MLPLLSQLLNLLRRLTARARPRMAGPVAQHLVSPHRRVRATVALMLALVGVVMVAQLWWLDAMDRQRLNDSRIVALAHDEALLSQQLGRAALMATQGEAGHHAAAALLQQALLQSRQQALLLGDLVGRQQAASPASQAALLQAIEQWHGARERLWYRAEIVLLAADASQPARLIAAATELQRTVEPAALAAGMLAQRSAAVAQARHLQGMSALRARAFGLVVLLVLLALLLGEPTVRAVQRQHGQLARQADELDRLLLVTERTGNAMVATDRRGRVLWANPAFCTLCACTDDVLQRQLLIRLLGRAGVDAAALGGLSHALGHGQSLGTELQGQRADGSAYCLQFDLQPLLDGQGVASGFVAVMVDVTDRVTQRLRHAALLAALPNGVVMRGATGELLECNPAALAQLQRSRAQLAHQPPVDAQWQILRADGRPMPREDWPAAHALRTGQGRQGQLLGVMAGGHATRWLLANTELIHDAAGQSAGTVTCFTDVTEQRNQQAVLAHTVEAAGLGTWQWHMGSGQMQFNDRLLTMLGWRPGDMAQTMDAWSAHVHPDDRARWQAALRRHLDNPLVPCRTELRVRRPDGHWAAVLSCGVVIERDATGAALRMAGINIDMTEQMQMQAMLRHAARTDGLTQLPNRAAVFDHVQQVLDRAQLEPGFGYAVLFMDFDRFKQVNDTLGHSAGDELLRQIAQRLRGALRAGDGVQRGALSGPLRHTAGRIGGDEFVVVLEGVHHRDDACTVARRLMDVLAQPYQIGAQLVHSGASIGIVTSEQPANDAHLVMRDADTAMYEAKRAGRGRYVVFDPSMHERVASGVQTERDLRLALQRDELFVVYQPVVELQQPGPGSVEALVRWNHPTRGLVSPLQFIGVAEESGLIVELGRLVLATACRQFTAWQQALGPCAPVSLAVNLSPMQLRSPGLVADVQQCLRDSGIPPGALQLEVTESLAAQDDAARAKLRELKALGVRIALDDFGTGYSSLACLHQLPVDTVKIDRSFVMHAETSDYHRVLIEATIRVAQTLGMGTVAEGIETSGQAALMRRLHCDRGQGYLFSRPLDADALVAWLRMRADVADVRAA